MPEKKILEYSDLKKIRTIRDVIRELKSLDEHTALTENALRTLVKNQQIRSVKIGKKYLLTLQDVLDFFS